MEKECIECNKIFKVKPSHFNRRKCCSKKCQAENYKTTLLGNNNPNYKNKTIGEFTCRNCNNIFNKKTYQKAKICSIKCSSEYKSKIHTGKVIFNKRKKSTTTLQKMICICGNKKYLKAHICMHCFIESKKRKLKNCIVCKNLFYPNTIKSILCSIECIKKYKQNITKQENNPNWKGGVGSINQIERRTKKFKEWRLSVFKRDNFTCLDCNKKGGNLNAHHILPFAKYKELRFEITNGKTLCFECHKKYHPSMNLKTIKSKKTKQLQ